MTKLFYFVLLLQVFATIAGPLYNDYRLRRSPHRAIMVSGYYPSEYQPRSRTTAFISGETVATNSYLGGRDRPEQEEEELDLPVDSEHKRGSQQAPAEALPEEVPPKPKQKPPRPQEDDDEEDTWVGRRTPSFNTFFPIMFGGYGGKGRSDEGGSPMPGSATAIANSYSTGRGGIATSRATAYGDPYSSSFFRNGINSKRKPAAQEGY